jgi:hypothetical protein
MKGRWEGVSLFKGRRRQVPRTELLRNERRCRGKESAHRVTRICWICASEGSSASHFPCDVSWVRRVLSTWASVIARSSYSKHPSVSALVPVEKETHDDSRCKRDVTYHSQRAVSRLQGAEMTRIWLLPSQNRVPGIHPAQSCVGPQVRSLALEPAHCCVNDDSVSDVSLKCPLESLTVHPMSSPERGR